LVRGRGASASPQAQARIFALGFRAVDEGHLHADGLGIVRNNGINLLRHFLHLGDRFKRKTLVQRVVVYGITDLFDDGSVEQDSDEKGPEFIVGAAKIDQRRRPLNSLLAVLELFGPGIELQRIRPVRFAGSIQVFHFDHVLPGLKVGQEDAGIDHLLAGLRVLIRHKSRGLKIPFAINLVENFLRPRVRQLEIELPPFFALSGHQGDGILQDVFR
jgi:hypothetical protein